MLRVPEAVSYDCDGGFDLRSVLIASFARAMSDSGVKKVTSKKRATFHANAIVEAISNLNNSSQLPRREPRSIRRFAKKFAQFFDKLSEDSLRTLSESDAGGLSRIAREWIAEPQQAIDVFERWAKAVDTDARAHKLNRMRRTNVFRALIRAYSEVYPDHPLTCTRGLNNELRSFFRDFEKLCPQFKSGIHERNLKTLLDELDTQQIAQF